MIHSFISRWNSIQRIIQYHFFRNIQFKKLFINLLSQKIQFKNWFKNVAFYFFQFNKWYFPQIWVVSMSEPHHMYLNVSFTAMNCICVQLSWNTPSTHFWGQKSILSFWTRPSGGPMFLGNLLSQFLLVIGHFLPNTLSSWNPFLN